MQRTQTRKLVFGALLTALAVVLKSFLGIPVSMFGGLIKDINFSASIVMYAGIALGPVYGAIVGALTDVLCAIIRPLGAYMPLFTLTNALMGLLPALFFLKNKQHGFWKHCWLYRPGKLSARLSATHSSSSIPLECPAAWPGSALSARLSSSRCIRRSSLACSNPPRNFWHKTSRFKTRPKSRQMRSKL